MDLINDLKWRGILNNITNEEKLVLAIKENKAAYVGFDPSADSLHLGNFVMIQLLNRLKKFNIHTYAVLGGATGMIGDPSGKSSERNLLDPKLVEYNKEAIKKQLQDLAQVEVLDNYDLYKDMNFLEFLRDVGKLINVNYMLEKDSIKTRLETGISFTEFSYTLIQGNDFLSYYQKYGVAIQAGGSDQWGNITTGIEMIRKVVGDDNLAVGFTVNLLTKADGTKFGKSEKGAIFLDPKKTSVYEMYQFLINQPDNEVIKLLKFLTFLDQDEILKLEEATKETPHLKLAQKELAKQVVVQIHGEKAYQTALEISEALFSGDIKKLSEQQINDAFKNMGSVYIEDETINLVDLLVLTTAASSKRQAREFIANKAVSVNGDLETDENKVFSKKDLLFNKFLILKRGKRNYYVCEWK